MKIKLSIIIPVYNTEEYMRKCIDSCLDQDIETTEYEIILIDDGSTDGSLKILREYQSKNENIIVRTQENKKQGAARNHGLKYAQGKYIWFVDSDDWIEPNVLNNLIRQLEQEDLDLLAFGVNDSYEYDNSLIKRQINYEKNKICKGQDVLLAQKFMVNIPFHIFRKEFLVGNNFQILENIYYEDNEYMIRVFDKVERFMFIDLVCYNVLNRKSSTTRNNNYVNCFGLIKVIESLMKYVEENKQPYEVKKVFHRQIAECQNSLLFGTRKSKQHFNEAVKSLKEIDGLKFQLHQSHSIVHILQYELLRFPSFLRNLLILFYR